MGGMVGRLPAGSCHLARHASASKVGFLPREVSACSRHANCCDLHRGAQQHPGRSRRAPTFIEVRSNIMAESCERQGPRPSQPILQGLATDPTTNMQDYKDISAAEPYGYTGDSSD